MAIDVSLGSLLCRARRRGARFDRTATIGRLALAMSPQEVEELARDSGVPDCDAAAIARDAFSDAFLRALLGARSVQAIDASDYQGAAIVHDLNQAIDPALHRSCDAVVDGGTLEHVFDVKTALANYMNLVRRGGDLFICTPANNLCGHGFYQFGPELFCRVFEPANGFAVRDLVLIEAPLVALSASPRRRLFQVDDPAAAGRRVYLVNDRPVSIFVHARRIGDEAPFARSPVQSDYRRKWQRAEPEPEVFAYPTRWEQLRRGWKQWRRKSFHNRSAFRPLDLRSDAR